MKDQAHTQAEDVDGTIIFENPVFNDSLMFQDEAKSLAEYHCGLASEYRRELSAALEQNARLREQLVDAESQAAAARSQLELLERLKAGKPIVVKGSAMPRQYHRTEKEKTQDTIALVAKIRAKLERHGMGVFGQDDISVLAGAIAAGIEEALR